MKAYITIGMPASGKTTWAEEQLGFININLDDCRAEVCGDAGNHSATPEAVVLHDLKIKQAASNRLDIIISDTNLNQKYRDVLVQKIMALGYEIEYYLFPISLEIAKDRNSKRKRIVPEEIIDKMFQNFQENTIVGNILLGNNHISSDLISELNQLANLKILIPSSALVVSESQLLSLDMILLEGNRWESGPKLNSWLKDRGLLQETLVPYLSSNLENILDEEFKMFSTEINLSSLTNLCSKMFSGSVSEDKQLEIASLLIQNKSLLKTCFDENDKLTDSAKLSEIIKEILK